MLQAQGARCLGNWLLLVATVSRARGCLGRGVLCRHSKVWVRTGVQAEAVEGRGGLQCGNVRVSAQSVAWHTVYLGFAEFRQHLLQRWV